MQALEVSENRTLRHFASLFQGIAFRDKAGERGTSNNEPAFLSRFEKYPVAMFDHGLGLCSIILNRKCVSFYSGGTCAGTTGAGSSTRPPGKAAVLPFCVMTMVAVPETGTGLTFTVIRITESPLPRIASRRMVPGTSVKGPINLTLASVSVASSP